MKNDNNDNIKKEQGDKPRNVTEKNVLMENQVEEGQKFATSSSIVNTEAKKIPAIRVTTSPTNTRGASPVSMANQFEKGLKFATSSSIIKSEAKKIPAIRVTTSPTNTRGASPVSMANQVEEGQKFATSSSIIKSEAKKIPAIRVTTSPTNTRGASPVSMANQFEKGEDFPTSSSIVNTEAKKIPAIRVIDPKQSAPPAPGRSNVASSSMSSSSPHQTELSTFSVTHGDVHREMPAPKRGGTLTPATEPITAIVNQPEAATFSVTHGDVHREMPAPKRGGTLTPPNEPITAIVNQNEVEKKTSTTHEASKEVILDMVNSVCDKLSFNVSGLTWDKETKPMIRAIYRLDKARSGSKPSEEMVKTTFRNNLTKALLNDHEFRASLTEQNKDNISILLAGQISNIKMDENMMSTAYNLPAGDKISNNMLADKLKECVAESVPGGKVQEAAKDHPSPVSPSPAGIKPKSSSIEH